MDILITEKLGSQVTASSSANIYLNQPSVVKVPVSPDQVSFVTRDGMDLLVELNNGEQLRLTNFFATNADGVSSDLLFEDENGSLWHAQPASEAPRGFTLEEIGSIDDLLLVPAAATETSLAGLAIGLGAFAVGAGAIVGSSGSGSSSDEISPGLAAPADLLVNAAGSTLTGTATPGTLVEVRNNAGELLGSAIVASDGSFSLALNPPQTAGQTLQVSATDDLGNSSPIVEVTAPSLEEPGPDETAPDAPQQLAISNAGDLVSGRGEAGANVFAVDPNGVVLGSAVVGADGLFSIAIEPPQRNGETLQVYLQDDAGNVSVNVPLLSPDITAPAPPSALVLSADGLSLSGTAEPGVRVEVRDVDGALIGAALADMTGAFTVVLDAPMLNGESLEVRAIDAAANTSLPSQLNAPDTTPPGPATDVVISPDLSVMSGKGEAGTTVTVSNSSGDVLGTAVVSPGGSFQLNLTGDIAEGDLLQVVLSDAAGNESDSTTVTAPDAGAPDAPTNLEVSENGTVVSGSAAPGNTVEVRAADGSVVGSVVVPEDGDFTVELVPPQVNGESLDVVVKDTDGDSSVSVPITAPDITAPDAATSLAIAADGMSLSGRGEPGTTATALDAQGEVLGSAVVSGSGTFSITLLPPQIGGQTVQVTLTDAAGNTSDDASIDAPNLAGELLPAALELDSTGTLLSGTGQAGSVIQVTDADGTVLGSTAVPADGSFVVELNSPQNNGETLTIDATNPANGESVTIDFVAPDTQPPSSPSELSIDELGASVTGLGEPNATITVRSPDGSVIGTAQADATGGFTVPLVLTQADGEILTVTQTDLAGNVSAPISLTAPDLTAPLEPGEVVISADGLIVSGVGEIGATVEVRDADGSLLGSTLVGSNGRFEALLDEAQLNGQQLAVTQVDAAGNGSPAISLSAPDVQAPQAPTGLMINEAGSQLTGLGEAGANVTVLDSIGTVIGSAQVAEDGSFEVTLAPPQNNGQPLQVSQIDAADNLSPPSSITAPDTSAPSPVTNIQISTNGATVSGSGEAGATVTVRNSNGDPLGSALVAANGTFTITLNEQQLDGQLLDVVQADPTGNVSVPVELTAPDITAPPQPGNLLLDVAGIVLSGTAEANSIIEVKSADGTSLGIGAADETGAFTVTLDAAQLNGELLQVTASDGSNISPPASFQAQDSTPPMAVEDLAITPDGVSISGYGEPASNVVVRDANDTVLGSGTADDDGLFVIQLDPAAESGDVLSVVSSDQAGNSSPPVLLDGPDGTELAMPFNLLLAIDGVILTGNATAGSTVTCMWGDGTILGTSLVSESGSFIMLLAFAQLDGEMLHVYASEDGDNSVPAILMAADMTAPNPITEAMISADGSSVTGNGEAGATVTVSSSDGAIVGTAIVGANGSFSVTLAPVQDNAQSLILEQRDGVGNLSQPVSLIAPDLQAPEAPTALSINAASTVVSGLGEAGAIVSIRNAAGAEIATGLVNQSGEFQVTLPAAQTSGETLQVTLTDPAGNTSPASDLATLDTTPPPAAQNLAVSADGTSVSGTGEIGATVSVADSNGNTLGSAIVNASGEFVVQLTPAQLNGELLDVSLSDASGNVSPSSSISAPDLSPPAALTQVVANADGVTLTGNGEPGATVEVRGADGALLGSGLVGDSGAFSVTLDQAQINAEVLTVTQEDPPGNVSVPVTVIAVDLTPPAAPVELELNDAGLQLSGRAEPASSITVRNGQGTLIGSGIADADGTFVITLATPQNNGQTLSVTASDAASNTSPATALIAPDTTAPSAVTNVAVNADGTQVTGIGEPNALISVRDAEGAVLGSATAASNGTFVVALEPAAAPGDMLGVLQSDAAGNDSPEVSVRAPGNLAEEAPSDLALADGVILTGTATPGSAVSVYALDAEGNLLGSGLVNSDGTFTIVLNDPQLNGEELAVVATSTDGTNSSPTSFTAPDVTAPDALQDLALTPDGMLLTGRGEAGATVSVLAVGGAQLGTATVLEDGTFSLELASPQIAGQILSVSQADDAGNESVSVDVSAPDLVAPDAPAALAVSGDGAVLTGIGEPGASVTVRNAAGTEVGSGVVRIDGSFQIELSSPQANGELLSVNLRDAAGNVSPSTPFTSIDITAPPALSQLAISSDGATITGLGEANALVTVFDSEGAVLGTATVTATGTFTLVLDEALGNAEVLTLVQTDSANNVSPATTLDTPDFTAPDPLTEVSINSSGALVTGMGEPGANVTVRDASGTLLGSGLVLANGSFSVALMPPQINKQVLNVQQADPPGNVSAPIMIDAPDLTPPQAATELQFNATGDILTGVGESLANVSLTLADGTVVGTGSIGPDGSFLIELSQAQSNGEQVFVTLTDDAGNSSVASNIIAPDTTAPDAVSDLALDSAGLVLTGNGEPGAQLLVTNSLGDVIGVGLVRADGTFGVELLNAQVNGETVLVVQRDATGNASDATSITAADITPPAEPVITALSEDGLTLSGTGEAGATVNVRSSDGTLIGTVLVEEDGSFDVTLDTPQLNGEVLSVRQVDEAGNRSAPVTYQADDVTAPDPVEDLVISQNGLSLSGMGEPGALITVTNADGDELGTALVTADGDFAVTLSSAQLNGEVLSVSQSDAATNESEPVTVQARDITAPLAPTVTSLTEAGTQLNGTAEAGSTVTVRTAGGVLLGSIVADEDGNYEVALNAAQLNGESLTVVATDEAGNNSTVLNYTAADVTAPDPVTELAIAPDYTQLSGRGEPGATVTVTDADDNLLGTATVTNTGLFTVVLTGEIGANDALTIVQSDPSGNESTEAGFTVPVTPPPAAPTDLALTSDGLTLTGTATAGTAITVYDEAGGILGTGVTTPGGSFSILLNEAQLNGETLGVTASTPTGGPSSPTELVAGDTTAPDPLDNLAINATGTQVTGTGEVGATVTILSGITVIGTAVVASNGTFSAPLSPAQANGQALTAQQEDAAGNTSTALPLTAPDITPPAEPVITALSEDGLILSGTGEAGATVNVRSANGTLIGTIVVEEDGSFDVTLDTPQLNGEVLSVRQVDEAGNRSAPVSYQTDDVTAPDPVEDLVISQNGLSLSGMGEPGALITVTNADGDELGTALVTADGDFTVTLSSAQLNGEVLSVSQSDAATNESEPVTVQARDITAPLAPTVTSLIEAGTQLNGTAEAGSTVTVRTAGGTLLGSIVADEDGNYAVPLNTAQLNGENLTVVATDAAGNNSSVLNYTADDVTAPDPVTELAIAPDYTQLSGRGEPGATVTVTDADDNLLGTATVTSTGLFTVVLTGEIGANDALTIVQSDPSGNESTEAGFTVPVTPPPASPADLALDSDGLTLTGTATAGTAITVYDEVGGVIGTGITTPEGNFTVVLDQAQLNGETLGVTASTPTGGPSAPTELVAGDTTAPEPLDNLAINATGTQVTGTGEVGATVTILSGITVIGTAVVASNGTFSAPLSPAQANGQALTAQQEDAAGNISPALPLTAPDITPPVEPVITALSEDGLTLSGTGEAGATVNVRSADGMLIGTIVVEEDGSFDVTLDTPQLNGELLSVRQVDEAGNRSAPVTFQADDVTSPDPVEDLVISQNGLAVSGMGEPGALITVTNADGDELGTAVVTADGDFTVTLSSAQLNGEVLLVSQSDASINESEPVTVQARDITAPLAPTVTSLTEAGTQLNGTAEAGSTVTVRTAGGMLLGSVVADEDGNYAVPLNTAQLNGESLTVVATDEAGNNSTVLNYTAADVTAPDPVTELAIAPDYTQLSGRGEPGATVTVTDAEDNLLGTATVTSTGLFTVVLTGEIGANDALTIAQTDAAGNASPDASFSVPVTPPPASPADLALTPDGLTLTGTATAGTAITVYDEIGGVIGTGVTTPEGNFTVVLDEAQLNGETLGVTASTPTGGPSSPTELVAGDTTAPEPLDNLLINATGTQVTGTGEVGATVTILSGITVIGTAVVASNGSFSATLTPAQANGQELTAQQEDAAGNISPVLPFTAPDITPPAEPVITALSEDGLTLSGTGEAGATVNVRSSDGTLIGTVVTGEDGSFDVTLDTPQLNGELLSVRQVDEAGNRSAPVTFQTDDVTAPDPVEDLVISQNGLSLSGMGEPGALITVTNADGDELGTALVTADGDFTVTLSSAQLNGEVLSVSQSDVATNASESVSVQARDITAPLVPTVVSLTEVGTQLNGTAEAGSTVTVRTAGGMLLGSVVADEDGNYAVPLNTAQLNGESLTVVATDEAGNNSTVLNYTAADVTAPDPVTELAIAPDYTQLSGRGEPGATVTVTDAEDNVLGTATVTSTGLFTVILTGEIDANDALTIVQADAAGNESPDASFSVPVTPPPASPANLALDPDGLTLTGTATAGTTITVYDEVGGVTGTGITTPEGNFTVVLDEAQLNGETLSVTASTPTGGPSAPTELIADDTTAPDPLDNLAINATGTQVTGTGEIGATVMILSGTTVVGTAVVASNGSFSATLTPAQANGQALTAQQEDAAGNTSPALPLTAPDITPPAEPVITALSEDGLTLSGTGEAGATVNVRSADGTLIGTVVADEDGSFDVALNTPQLNGELLSIRQVDEAGNRSAPVNYQADDVTAPDPVEDLVISQNGLSLSGMGEPGSSVSVYGEDNTLLGTAVVTADGDFTVTLSSAQLNGEVLSVSQSDVATNVSEPVTVQARDITAPLAPTVTSLTEAGTQLNGTAEAGSTVTVRTAGGTLLGSIVADEDGNYAVPLNAAQLNGENLTVVATDAAGNNSSVLNYTADDVTAPDPVTELAIAPDYTQLSGRGEPGATVTVTDADDNLLGTATVTSTGLFTVVLTGEIGANDALTIVQSDPTGNESTEAGFTVPVTPPPASPADLALDSDGLTLTGTATAGTSITVYDEVGGVIGTSITGPEGNFTVVLDEAQLNGETLGVTASTPTGGPSAPTELVAGDTTAPDPLDNLVINATGTQVTGTGEVGATVTILSGITVIATAVVANDGSFSATLTPAQANGQALTAQQEDAAGNTSPALPLTAPDITPPAEPVITALSEDGLILSGTGEAGATVNVRSADGTLIGTIVVEEDGSFDVTLDTPQLNGELLSIRQVDEAGNRSAPTTYQTADVTAPAAPADLSLNAAGQQLSGTGEAGSTVNVYGPGDALLGTATVAEDGSFSVLLSAAQLNGQELSVQQVDLAGNESLVSTLDATDVQAPGAATDLALTADGIFLSGMGEAGADVMVYGVGNVLIGTGTVGLDGLFTIELDSPQLDGETLIVRLTDEAGNTSAGGQFIAEDVTAPGAPQNVAVDASGTVVTGTGVAGSTVNVRDAEGALLGSATVMPTGIFNVALNAAQIDSQVVSVTQVDAAGNISDAATATAPDLTPPPAAGDLQVSEDGLSLDGTGEPGAAVVIRDANGNVLGTGQVGPEGTFTVALNGAQVNGESLSVRLTDSSGNASPVANVVAPDIDADAPVVATDDLVTASVTLTPVTATDNYTDSFTTLLSGFIKDFIFTVPTGTTLDTTLTLTTQSLVSLLDGVIYNLQTKDAAGNWQTIDVNGSGGLLDLLALGSQGVQVDINDLLAGDYRLRVSSTGIGVLTTVTTELELEVTSLTQFNGVPGPAVTGNVITDAGINGQQDQPGPDNGATLQILQNGSYVAAGAGTTVQGMYGSLVIDAEGNYSYTANGSASSVGKVDVFNYQLVHPNGLSDSANLYVRIDSPQATEIWDDSNPGNAAFVLDAVDDQATANVALINREETSSSGLGSFGLFLGNGSGAYAASVADGTVSDLTVVLNSSDLLSLLGSTTVALFKLNPATGTYQQVQSVSGGALLNLGGGAYGVTFEDQPSGTYQVRVGVSGIGLFGTVTTSLIKTATYTNQFVVGNTLPLTGNLLTGTAEGGGDTLGSALTVLSVLVAGSYISPGYAGTTINGSYGTLIVQADGSYSYMLEPGLPANVVGQSEVFTYQLTHPNGSTDTATLTIDLEAASGPANAAQALLAAQDEPGALAAEQQLQSEQQNELVDGSDGGAISLEGSDGNDTLVVVDQEFVSVDGGGGTNTLFWGGGDAAIDLSNLQDRLDNIDVLDLNDTSAVSLTLSLSDVLAIGSEDSDLLVINGDSQDQVHFTDQWNLVGGENVDGIDYTHYTSEEDASYHLWVQTGIQVV